MGLDISAYSRIRFVHGEDARTDECYDGPHIAVYGEDFPERLDGLVPGCYTSDLPGIRFHAGSYEGYNSWRAWLCQYALGVQPELVWKAPEDFAGRPFVELVNFADNEGTIGPVTSAKLAKDFANHHPPPASDGYYVEKYDEWHRAFTLAANDGCVMFH